MDGFIPAPWVIAPLVAFALSAALNGVARSLAPRIGWVDKPDGGRKLHKKSTPVMGGLAFSLAMFSVVSGAALLQVDWLMVPGTADFAISLFSSAALFCTLGVIDDRLALRPRTKLIGQFIASLPFALLSNPIEFVRIVGIQIDLGVAAVPFTILWLVACSNVINLIDGLDGLAATVGTISLLTIAALFGFQQDPGAATLTLIAAASILGFLCHNWPPARIFMGDGGSLTIGYLIGALSIQAASKTAAGYTLAVPVVLISIPIFDTVMAILRRKLNGRGIGEGDRGHIHHRLQDHGLSRKQALLTIGGLCLVMAGAAMLSALMGSEIPGLIICAIVLGTLIVGRVFGYQETALFYRHVQEVGALVVDTSSVLKTRFLLARIDRFDPRQRLEIWQKVAQRVHEMGGTTLEFRCTAADGARVGTDLEWTNSAIAQNNGGSVWQFVYSSPRSDGLLATIEVEGTAEANAPLQRLDDLFRLFARVCQEMPIETEDQGSETLTLPQPAVVVTPSRQAA